MAFTNGRLSTLGYARGFTQWHYDGANDNIATVASPEFFASATDLLAPGDHLLISAADGGGILYVGVTAGRVRTTRIAVSAVA